MNDLEFTFDEAPWQSLLDESAGGSVSALKLLALLEGEEEDTALEVLESLDGQKTSLDISDLVVNPTGQAALRLKQEKSFASDGIDLRMLEENDPLRVYLQEVSATPAFGDEDVLAMEAMGGSESDMAQLANLGLSRVIALASRQAGRGVLLLDLIQEGNLGLWSAIGSYCGGDYGAHRDFFINNAIARAVFMQARATGLGQKVRSAMEDYRAVDERLLSDLGRNPTTEELALELHMSVEETEAVRKMMDDARLLSMAVAPLEEKEEEEEADQAVEYTAYFQMRSRVTELLSVLSESESKLLSLRFGLDGGLPKSAAEVGAILGLTASEVSRLEGELLAKLRSEE